MEVIIFLISIFVVGFLIATVMELIKRKKNLKHLPRKLEYIILLAYLILLIVINKIVITLI